MTAEYLPAILRRYGTGVAVTHRGETLAIRAFVQPLRRRHRLYISDKTLPAGYFDNAYRLYIGDKAYPLAPGDRIRVNCNGDRYTVVTSEEFIVGGEVAYVWAILRPQNMMEDDYDDLDG